VAVLWLQFVHDLMERTFQIDDDELFVSHADRIERVLTHLESSSMPIPGMNLEDVIELGRDIAAGEATKEQEAREDAEDGAIEDRVESQIDALARIAGERQIPVCVDCGAPPGGPSHRDMCEPSDKEVVTETPPPPTKRPGPKPKEKCPKCTFTLASQSHRYRCDELAAAINDRASANENTVTPPVGTCTHHWVIESPNGGVKSSSVCKKCGMDREFFSSHEGLRQATA
jgi:hypothetical protein